MMAATFRDRVADYMRARPRQWVNGLTLEYVGGRYAWRTRLSECRTQLGMVIENRLRKDGEVTVSEYRYIPHGQMGLFE